MSEFDASKAYAKQEDVYFNDGREKELLEYVLSAPNLAELQGSPSRVLAAIDEYGRTKNYLMNVGADKGAIIVNLIEESRPEAMVELGGYVGYSTILFADALRRSGGKTYICLEFNPNFAAVIEALVDLAGLRSIVKVIVGPANASLSRLHSSGDLSKIDFLFLDHIKSAYVHDLKLCEYLGLIQPGSVLAADNVIKPGNPPYLEYVRSSNQEKRAAVQKTSNRFERGAAAEAEDEHLGNPNLVYKSKLIHSFEPTGIPDGVEITVCTGTELA